ncbi:MAG: nucleotidyltransferase family protein [Acidobacteria bacterium]|nr:nucleotidyltransferase family protein [Acidobacteriota bacterium]MCW5949112.1 nucleotidyltransferase family protein [Pyrinomonadaceae bacterium]
MKNDLRWNILARKRQEVEIARAYDTLSVFTGELLFIKGYFLGRYYPAEIFRDCSDVDVAVDHDAYGQILDSLGHRELTSLKIDLHSELRHLDSLDWDDIYASSIEVEIEGRQIRTPCPEDHVRIAAVHWLTDGGEYKHRLWDVYHLIDANRSSFNWSRCLDVVSATRRRWIVCVIGLAARYLGLDLSGTPIESEARNLPLWMTKRLEKEWESDVRLVPLHSILRDRHRLWQQIRKRVPPNPIQATIDVEGSLDSNVRFHYQILSAMRRVVPSVGRITDVLRNHDRR